MRNQKESSPCAGALIADDMGLGKTVQVIGYINATPKVNSVLIICPASLKLNWQQELQKWLMRYFTIGIGYSDYLPDTGIAIVNYDNIARVEDQVKAKEWDLLVMDESHYIKSGDAKRTIVVVGGTYKPNRKSSTYHEPIRAKRKIALSGTPIGNRPVELWPVLHYLDPDRWPSRNKFVHRYCGAFYDGHELDCSGATNLTELGLRLRSSLMIRRLKKDVLHELPDKIRQVIEIDRVGKAVQPELFNNASEIIRLRNGNFPDRVGQLKVQEELFWERIATQRKETGLEKVPVVLPMIQDAVISSGKVIVFAWTSEVIDLLEQKLSEFNPVVIKGSTPIQSRNQAVRSFQDDPDTRVFIGNIKAAGVGLTLTAANHVMFVEFDWTPGAMEQAIDRAHRIGQKLRVLAQYLVLRGSLDAYMAKAFVRKQKIIDEGLGDTAFDPVEELGN